MAGRCAGSFDKNKVFTSTWSDSSAGNGRLTSLKVELESLSSKVATPFGWFATIQVRVEEGVDAMMEVNDLGIAIGRFSRQDSPLDGPLHSVLARTKRRLASREI